MAASQADTHDLTKLERWLESMRNEEPDGFPVHAVFLVSSEHEKAHDVIRRFRESFQARGSGFRHLVIFGQHGLSSAAVALAGEWEEKVEELPLLALVTGASQEEVQLIPLPGRGRMGEDGWSQVLAELDKWPDGVGHGFSLPSMKAVRRQRLVHGSLAALAEAVTEKLQESESEPAL